MVFAGSFSLNLRRLRQLMEYSGHKSYYSSSVYLHKTDLGEERACLILEIVDGLLTVLAAEDA